MFGIGTTELIVLAIVVGIVVTALALKSGGNRRE